MKTASDMIFATTLLFYFLNTSKVDASMLRNIGYGSDNYGKELYSAARSGPASNKIEEILDEESNSGGNNLDSCSGKMCTANEHCCDQHVCSDADETMGTCLPVWGNKLGEHCYNDQDCASGFLCIGAGAKRTCQTSTPGDKLLGETCRTSSDCNVSKGLCCKLTRRARSQPKKICSYYVDPQNCLGPVASSPVL